MTANSGDSGRAARSPSPEKGVLDPGAAQTGREPLNALRARIDEIDARLISALCERAEVVLEIGRRKRETGGDTYVPHREQEVLARVLAANPGPLPNRTIEAIYRELMSGSFALESGLRIGYLGPEGSFSHLAALRQFGSSVAFEDLHSIEGVFEAVAAERVNYGLVPYENSIGGSITDTLDAFQQVDVSIGAETLVEITHCLLANCLPSEVKRIYSKPQVFEQCRKWIARRYPQAELIATASTAAAAQQAAREEQGSGAAAIGSALAGEIYGVNILFEKIEDKPNNITRFLIISKGAAASGPAGDGGRPGTVAMKTTIMFATAHKPGALVDVLSVFRDAQINLSHIEKRPSGRVNWEYTFFIDCEGAASDPALSRAIDEARQHCLSLRVLGSYPRAVRVL